jgi:dihydroorotase
VPRKINPQGFVFGGQTQVPAAVVSYVIELFALHGKLDLLPAFISHNGRDAYHLPRSKVESVFRFEEWVVPDTISRTSPTLGTLTARVAMGGQKRRYRPMHINVPPQAPFAA